MRAHSAYTPEGRAGLRRVVNYERSRFGWVRGTVADRLMTALEDAHAAPERRDPAVSKVLTAAAYEIANGNVAATALCAIELVELARTQRSPSISARKAAKG